MAVFLGTFDLLVACVKEIPYLHCSLFWPSRFFSHNMQSEIAHSWISPYKMGKDEVSLSHLLYADDVMFFTNGAARSLKNLMSLFQEYEKSSGKLINQRKSGFHIHEKYQRRAPIIARSIGLLWKEFPFIYLGVPIYYGRMKAIYFEHLIAKLLSALEGLEGTFAFFWWACNSNQIGPRHIPHIYFC